MYNKFGSPDIPETDAERAENAAHPAETWIERSTDEELAYDPQSPYRLCVADGDQRFALSTLDAIRAQKAGTPFRPTESEGR